MKILIVEDEAYALKYLYDTLKELKPDAELIPFQESEKALVYGEENDVDVAFLDVNMGALSGVELAKKLKEFHPTINIVFCTAYTKHAVDAIHMRASGYVTKPYKKEDIQRELDNLLYPIEPPTPKFFIRTFGDFDMFVEGVVVTFPRAKCKEMLAYLVYKNGSIANKQELAAVLFGDEYTLKTQNYLAHIYADLIKTLQKYNAEEILIKGHNQYAVDTNLFSCDYYDYNKGLPEAVAAYKGDFMSQYEWAVF